MYVPENVFFYKTIIIEPVILNFSATIATAYPQSTNETDVETTTEYVYK